MANPTRPQANIIFVKLASDSTTIGAAALTPESLGLQFPQFIPVGFPPVNYELATLQCAICHADSQTDPERGDKEPRWLLPAGEFIIVPTIAVDDGANYLPIYENANDVGLATGKLFARVAREAKLEKYREEFTRIDLVIQSVPAYAPHAGWIAAAGGDAGQALNLVATLASQPWVVHVEAQVLRAPRR